MKPNRLARAKQRAVTDNLRRLLVLHPEARVLCVSSGDMACRGIHPRSLKHAGYSKEANIIIIEYYE